MGPLNYTMIFSCISFVFLFLGPVSCTLYCFDKKAHEIFKGRLSSCVGGDFDVHKELALLKSRFISEYQRAHELYAYEHFVLNAQRNENYSPTCDHADLEYVPILPLSWRTGINSDTECTAGAVNCGQDRPQCSYRSLVSNIVDYWHLVQERPGGNVTHPRKFFVTSAFNFRSVLGMGMPSQRRMGEVWKTISAFTEASMLGSYERIVQCPDLLRRQFQHIVELPYIALAALEANHRDKNFFFGGRLRLWGPQRVCSVRASLAATLSLREDTLVTNVTYTTAGVFHEELVEPMTRSHFCIIAGANSYSSASFYTAIQNQCIPVVISDWFYFSFPKVIHYGEFVIRIAEDDFNKNPSAVMDAVLAGYDTAKRGAMRHAMAVAAEHFLDWGQLGSRPAAEIFNTMLTEMLEVDAAENKYIGYSGCTRWDPQQCPPAVYTPPIKMPSTISDTRGHLCQHAPRLIGRYKLVLFMQCARILWPIKAGNLRPADTAGLTPEEKTFLWRFHNLSGDGTVEWRNSWSTYPEVPEAARARIKQVVVSPGRFIAS